MLLCYIQLYYVTPLLETKRRRLKTSFGFETRSEPRRWWWDPACAPAELVNPAARGAAPSWASGRPRVAARSS